VAKVFKGKKISKGQSHPTTISPSSFITPYTPLKTDVEEAKTTLKAGEVVKIQLGAQIDGFGTIVCDNFVVPGKDGKRGVVEGREADLLLATHYANELLLRMMLPPGTLAATDEEKKAAAGKKQYTQGQMNALLEKVAKSYGCNLVESTTTWLFDRNEIEGDKKIILAPGEGVRGDGLPAIGEAWGVEMGLSLGTGKVKTLSNRATLHRRTALKQSLKRPSSRATLSEIVKKFGTFPFSMRQLEDERAAKVGIVESVRMAVLRQYEVVADKDMEPVSRLLTTIGKSFMALMSETTGILSWMDAEVGPVATRRANMSKLSRKTAFNGSLRHLSPISVCLRQTRRLRTRRSLRFWSSLLTSHQPTKARTKRRRRSQLRRRQQRQSRTMMTATTSNKAGCDPLPSFS